MIKRYRKTQNVTWALALLLACTQVFNIVRGPTIPGPQPRWGGNGE